MKSELTILLLEDVASDAELVTYELRKAGIAFRCTRVETGEDFGAALRSNPPDIILSDFSLPSIDGVEALAMARTLTPDIPFIFVSGAIGEDTAIEMLKTGATDYVLKNRLGRLPAAVQRALREVGERIERDRAREELRASHEQLRALAVHLQSIREDERAHIARELHDELGQVLTALRMDVSWMQIKLGESQPEVAERIGSTLSLIDSTIRSVRKIATDLRPGILDDLGLVAAIEWQAREVQSRAGIPCSLVIPPPDFSVDKNRTTAVFRIFQEALTNIVRHANATKIEIRLDVNEGQLKLDVLDNGRGINSTDVLKSHSLGLLGMQERAQILGGTVHIAHRPSGGTAVTLRMPLPQA